MFHQFENTKWLVARNPCGGKGHARSRASPKPFSPLSVAYPCNSRDISKKSVEIHFLHKIAPLQQGKTCFSRSSAPLQLQISERPVRLYSQVSPLNIKIEIILNKNIVPK